MRIWTFLVGLGAVLFAVAAAAVFVAGAGAQDADGTGQQTMIERVAGKLGISVDTLRSAFKDARLDAVGEAQDEGRISDEQAARIRGRIEEGKSLGPLGRRHAMHHAREAIVESAASALGMTAEELREERRSGKSIADVAVERGVGIDDVKAQVVADAEAKLADRVEAGRIDQQRADAALANLQERLDAILTRAPTVTP
jgi:hypothetical protein